MEESRKRKLPDVSFDNVNWRQLFLKYDEDKNGSINIKEFTFFVRDLLSLRDNNDHVSLEDALVVSKTILNHPFFEGDGQVHEIMISLDKLKESAKEGAFDKEQMLPEYFMVLSGDDSDVPPLMVRVSSNSVKHEQKLRNIVQSALRSGKLKNIDKVNTPSMGNGGDSADNHQCAVCFECFDKSIMYGGCNIPKVCSCDILLCLPCLTASARSQIVEGRRPTCPHMLSSNPPRRCTVPIDQFLLAQLFKNMCPLCETTSSDSNPLLSVGCLQDVYHSFCSKCLFDNIKSCLKKNVALQCPRYAECRGVLEESTLRAICAAKDRVDKLKVTSSSTNEKLPHFKSAVAANGKSFALKKHISSRNNGSDVETIIEEWYNQRLNRLRQSYSGSKPCNKPGCHGLLTASLDSRRKMKNNSVLVSVSCDACKKDQCWNCGADSHPSLTCIQLAVHKNNWIKFLRKIATETDGNLSAADTLLKYEQSAQDTLYFKRNIAQGNLKKCPKCSRLIEKMQGCDAMVCGRNSDGGNQQNGCGYSFSWSSVPISEVDDIIDIDDSKGSVSFGDDFELNLTDEHYDISDPKNPSPLRCLQCAEQIAGTRFVCVNCNWRSCSDSLCLSCVRKEIGAKSDISNLSSQTTSTNGHPAFSFGNPFSAFPAGASSAGKSSTGSHQSHAFQLVHPPKIKSAIVAAAVLSSSGDGTLTANCLQPSQYRGPVGSSDPFNYRPASSTDGIQPTLVLVKIYPDGRIIYDDNHCRAVDWLSLDSIMYPVDTKPSFPTNTTFDLNFDKFDAEDKVMRNIKIEKGSKSVPLIIFEGGSFSFKEDMTDKDFQKHSKENPLSTYSIGKLASCYDIDWAEKLAVVVRNDKLSPVLIMPPSAVKNNCDAWVKLPPSPNESFSVTADYFVDGNICHISGTAVKDFAKCSLKKRTTDGCIVNVGDLITVLPSEIKPLGVHDVVVVIDESACECVDDSIDTGVAVLRFFPDGRVHLLAFLGNGVKCPLRIFLGGIHFPISQETNAVALSLASDVHDHPAAVTDHSKKQMNIYCGRKRSKPCQCGNCPIGNRCGPHGCSCHLCLELEAKLQGNVSDDRSQALNSFVLKCEKLIQQTRLQQSGTNMFGNTFSVGNTAAIPFGDPFRESSNSHATNSSDANIFGRALVHTCQEGKYCCLSGQVFKHRKERSILHGAVRPAGATSGNPFPVGQDNPVVRRRIIDSDDDEYDSEEDIPTNTLSFGTIYAPIGVWNPGDLIATLPEGVQRPEKVITFSVIAGKGALGNNN